MSQESNEELIDRLQRDIDGWEGQEVEFMGDYPTNASELSKEIAAFATLNAGTIYLGVDKNRNIRGVSTIKDLGEAKGKDSMLDRVSQLTQKTIKPPIRVTIDFIKKVEEKIVVVKINIPKGVEPVYYSDDIPRIRILTSSDRATPDQVKELHRQYFLGQGTFEGINETQNFLTNTLAQLSDFQILWSDYENRSVNPDLDQMKYDTGSTGRMLLELSMESNADKLGLSNDLQQLGDFLEEIEHHEFYMDGGKSRRTFCNKGDRALELTNRLLQRVLKRYQLQEGQFDSIKDAIVMNIKELKHCWLRKELYLLAGELSLLKDTLRRLAFNFNRFGNITPQSENFNFKLRQLAKNLREISSDKYFEMYRGHNPLEDIQEKMEENLQISESILNEIEP